MKKPLRSRAQPNAVLSFAWFVLSVGMSFMMSPTIHADSTSPAGPSAENAHGSTKRYVQADVLRIRTRPDEGAPVLGRLQIGTAVEVSGVRKGWAKVTFNDLSGWASSSLLVDTPLSISDAMGRARTAKGRDRAMWLDRAVAIDPANTEAWTMLVAAADAADLPERARDARLFLAGAQPIFFTVCRGRADLELAYAAGAGFRDLSKNVERASQDEGDMNLQSEGERLRRELERLVEELPAAAWYQMDGTRLSASSFPQPKRNEIVDECTTDWMHLSVELGRCESHQEGVAVTVPLRKLKSELSSVEASVHKALAARGINMMERIEVRRIPGEPALREVLFAAKFARDRAEEARRVVGWALIGEALDIIALDVIPDDGKKQDEPNTWREIGIVQWANWSRLAVGPPVRIAIVSWDSKNYSIGADGERKDSGHNSETAGYWIIVLDERGRASKGTVITWDQSPC